MVNIKDAAKEDLHSIIDLGELLQVESGVYEPDIIYNRQEAYNHYLSELKNPNARIIIAIDDEKIVGYQYSFIEDLNYLSTNNRQCTLEALYLLPNARNNGTGRKLVEEAERWALEDMKANRIKANIYVGNTASESIHINEGYKPHNIEYLKLI